MQLDFDEERIKEMQAAPSLRPFSEKVTEFLGELSAQLFKMARSYPDVIAFAYWCRKAALASYAKNYEDLNRRLGRGLTFHIAPSNVPVNFAFSLAAGLLAGNKNVVRLPGKESAQAELICGAIEKAFEKYPDMTRYVYPIRYDKASGYTDILSRYCSVRVIWGGDDTIRQIRRSELPARAFDITFADRFSFCVIQGDDYLAIEDKRSIASDFYNDTYLSDQNACTSPHIVFWMGNSVARAKDIFWKELQALVDERYELQAVQAVGKLDAFCVTAMKHKCCICGEQGQDHFVKNNLVRVELKEPDKSIRECRYHSGFFFEYQMEALTDILALCDEKCQTISYVGNIGTEIERIVAEAGVNGADRIVPVGRTMDFSLVWDGYDLIRAMSRIVERR